jgi:hypothetical protein
MRRALAVGLVVLGAALAAGVAPERAEACSCAQLDLAWELTRADAIFVGTMLSRRVERRRAGVSSSDDPAYTRFRVETLIKGDLESPLEVVSNAGGESCGLEVKPGQRIGLLLQRVDRRWRSDLCSQLPPAQLLVAAGLGDGENEQPGAHFPRLNVGGYVVGAFVLALLAFLLARRLRRRPA